MPSQYFVDFSVHRPESGSRPAVVKATIGSRRGRIAPVGVNMVL